MKNLLAGELALVTGAGQGIGEAIAVGLADHGAAVVATDIDGTNAERTAGTIRARDGEASAHTLDVSDLDACRAVAAELERTDQQVSILINNAGIETNGPVTDPTAIDDWRATMAVNADGVYHTTLAFLDALKARRGRIVNIASVLAYVTMPGETAYVASKGAVRNLTISLAAELAPFGIRVNALAPGMVKTAISAATRANPEKLAKFFDHVPMNRYAEPEELVGPVVFLVSEMSSYVTGVVLPVDGGYLTV